MLLNVKKKRKNHFSNQNIEYIADLFTYDNKRGDTHTFLYFFIKKIILYRQ